MMKKLTLSLIVITSLMLMMIGVVSAFPQDYGIFQPDPNSGTVEWTDAQANSGVYSAYLMAKLDYTAGSDSNEVYIHSIDPGITTLSDLESMSFWYYRPSGTVGGADEIPPQIDIWLDTDGDYTLGPNAAGDENWLLGQIPIATTHDEWVKVLFSDITWWYATPGIEYVSLAEAKADTPDDPNYDSNLYPTLGDCIVVAIGVGVGSPATRDDLRTMEQKYYIDDIELNGAVYDFEPPTEVWVDDDDATCGGNSPCYATIQDGIDIVAEGGTVNVADGTYNENIVIGKSLTVRGANAGIAATGERGPESIIDAQLAEFAVLINGADTVATFDGFTVENYDTIGILGGAFSVVLEGVTLGDDPVAVHILNNIVNPPTIEAPHNNNIQIGDGTTGTIIGNDVSGALLESPDWSGSGIIVAGSSNVLISYNYVHNSEGGIQIIGYAEYRNAPAENNIIEYNLVEDNEGGIVPQMNSIGTIIRYNDVLNNDEGIAVMAIDYDGWPEHSAPSGTQIHYNNIDGNGKGVVSGVWNWSDTGVLAEQVDSTNNWWGAADGPSGEGSGTGDSVSTNVDYDPWCLNDECTNLGGEGADFIALTVPEYIDYLELYGFSGFKSQDVSIVLENVGSLDITVTPYLVVENSDPVFEYINFKDDGNSGLINVFSTFIGMGVTNPGVFPPIFSSEKQLTTWIELTESLGKLVGPQTGTIYFQAVEA